MQKIPTLYVRDERKPSLVTSDINPAAAWVETDPVLPTVKKDGTSIMVVVEKAACLEVWKRRNPTREEKEQGVEPSYVPADAADPNDQHIFAAVEATEFFEWPDGNWPAEALGPKIQGGVESMTPRLYPFTVWPELVPQVPINYQAIAEYLEATPIEGIVWHGGGGRMAKIKRRDFGIPWPPKEVF